MEIITYSIIRLQITNEFFILIEAIPNPIGRQNELRQFKTRNPVQYLKTKPKQPKSKVEHNGDNKYLKIETKTSRHKREN